MKNIAIIGGGAAGLAAAVAAGAAAKGRGISVTLFERNPRVGKKLLATGNGRCNISNKNIDVRFYHSQTPEILQEIIRGSADTVASFFKSIGIIFSEEDGRLYPYGRVASTVLDMLRLAADKCGVKTLTDSNVSFENFTNLLKTSKVILAAGGLAAPHTGSTGDGLSFLSRTGHKLEPDFPALTSFILKHPLPSLKGIRVKPCRLSLAGESSTGEVLFTDYGLSGIPAMQISGAFRKSAGASRPADIHMDLFPEMTRKELLKLFEGRGSLGFKAENFYAGLFHKNLCAALIKEGADVKDWVLPVNNTMGYAHAQVSGGGASLSCFDRRDMSSKVCQNLYASGELLDVYGDCGGYNLHWAWTTGILAGRGAVKSLEEGL